MGDKSQVLEAVLKEAVDLVTDLNHSMLLFLVMPSSVPLSFFDGSHGFFFFFCLFFWGPCECRRTYPLRRCLRI